MSVLIVVVLAVAGFISWLISTLTAGGGGLLLVPVVTLLLGARAVPPVLGVGETLGSPGRAILMREHIRWEVSRWYLPGGIAGGILGAWLFSQAKAEWFQVIIGVFLISTLFQYRFGQKARTFPMKAWYFLPVGFAVAFLSGLIGTMGPILNPFYLNYGAIKEEMIATKSFNSAIVHLIQIGTYTAFGALTWELAGYGLVIGVMAILAGWVGQRLLERMHAEQFRQVVVAMMVISGVLMIWDQRDLILSWIERV